MNKSYFFIIMTSLLLVMVQCKKNKDLYTPTNGDAITITLNVERTGTKVNVNPSSGIVSYTAGDAIHVVSGGKYVGTLRYNGDVFSGSISDVTEGIPLHFFFLGNVTPEETLVSGETESCTIVISDQTSSFPVISTALSNENYSAERRDYTASMINKCALVKFNVTSSSESATCIVGMNNKVIVDFSANTFTWGKEGRGVIKLANGSGERWAILLPQDALESGTAYSEDNAFWGVRGAVPTITENSYLTTGINISLSIGGFPGAINSLFTINENGDQVYFSKGNLQYNVVQGTHATADGGTAQGTFRFAEHQYDCIGEDNSNTSPTYDGWIDLFCRATSGWDNGCTYYQPWNCENVSNGNYGELMTGDYAYSDWGVYNAISNGGNEPSLWRILTVDEWEYIINGRDTPSGIRYAKATVNGLGGAILLPDNWNSSVYTFTSPNMACTFDSNVISIEDWQIIESSGAVFLPAGGARHYGNAPFVYFFGQEGTYWASTYSGQADDLDFTTSSGLWTAYMSPWGGVSVRLVHDAN